jgi:tetratricopeptide (TPR) repeat protein
LGKWHYAAAHLENLLNRMRLTYHPARHMQVLIHLGMIYKEQGAYGKARKTLEQALELAFQHHFFNEQNEIKLHLGHLYLLVHALLYAVEYLSEARRWAEKTQNAPLQIMANLYLSFYEVQNRRFDRAHRLLVSAKKLVNTSGELMDYLNYLFYYALYLLEREQPQKARVLVEQMLKRAPEWGRYRAAAYYLQGRAYAQQEQIERAEKAFQRSREIARQCGYPQILYLVECEWVRLLHRQNERNRFNQFLPRVCATIQTIADKIDDEILRRQFLEARYHEDIRYWCDLAE